MTAPAVPATETLTRRAERALDELGLTADCVADRLRALEIKGEPKSLEHCPVANYLRSRIAGLRDVEVTGTATWVAGDGDTRIVTTPAPVAAFVRDFDLGIHLDLVQSAGVAA